MNIDSFRLQQTLQAQGDDWYQHVSQHCPHLFAPIGVSISSQQYRKMCELITAIECAVQQVYPKRNQAPLGVFFGYDFHLTGDDGIALIEINTNAGGGFLNVLLRASQKLDTPDFVAMFRHEWQLARGMEPLRCIAIIDEQPETQFLYPEFILAQRQFEQAGWKTLIVAPEQSRCSPEGLFYQTDKIDLLYNRLTDFSLQQYPALLQAYQQNLCVVTPHPEVYQHFADKQNLVWLTDEAYLSQLSLTSAQRDILRTCIPQTRRVHADHESDLWQNRKQLFFKPNTGYGSKGAYRGDKLTKRVFAEILQSDYIAQQLAPPSEIECSLPDGQSASFKYDIRCYAYQGQIQMLAARLYQGQTTNFRTVGGGFAVVDIV